MTKNRTAVAGAIVLLFVLHPALFAASGLLSLVAGTGTAGSAGIGGDARFAQLNNPTGVCLDSAYNVFIADFGNNRVVRVNSNNGLMTLYAGDGQAASLGDGGPAALASITAPTGLAMDSNQNLYIAEFGSGRIRKVDFSYGTITTYAGNGSGASTGDGGAATAAGILRPTGIAFDNAGNLFIVELGHSIRRIDGQTGIITTVVDNSAGQISVPLWITVDQSQNLLVGDIGFHQVLKVNVSTGTVTPYVGNNSSITFNGDGGPAASTAVGISALSVSVDAGGNLILADGALNRIRRVDVATGIISTVAGNGLNVPVSLNSIPATSAALQSPGYIHAGFAGFTVFSDGANRVWRVDLPSPYTYTTTSIAVNPANPTPGQSMTYTATVAPVGGGGTPTGTVTFQDTSLNVFGIATLSGGTATLNTTAPAANGQYYVVASYDGDASFATSTSPVALLGVRPSNKVGTTTSIASAPNPSGLNHAVGINVTVTPTGTSAYQPSGAVQLLDGSAVVASGSIQNGSAYLQPTFATLGTHSLTAVYAGDSNFFGSTSAAVNQVVKNAATGYITSNPNPSTVGASVTLTATVYQPGATGTMEFRDYGASGTDWVVLGTAPMSAGAASFTISTLTPGTHNLNAAYSGDATYVGFGTSLLPQTVNGIGTTVNLTATQNPAVVQQPISIVVNIVPASGSAPSGGSVQLLEGSTSLGTAVPQNGAAQFPVTFATTGTHSLNAVYSGDATFQGSTSAVFSLPVKKLSTGAIATDANPAAAGSAVTFTVTVFQPDATGSVEFLDITNGSVSLGVVTLANSHASLTVSTLTVGTHSIMAAYSGDANYVSMGTSYFPQVIKAATTTSVSAPSGSSVYGHAVSFTAAISPSAATGAVQFFDGGASLGTATLSGGTAVLSATALSVGTHSVTATYAGDNTYAGSTSAAWTQTVAKATPVLTMSSSANPSASSQAVTFTVTLSPGATGTWQLLDGSTVLATNAVGTNSASATLALGSHSITATYTGDTNYNAVTSAVITQVMTTATATTVTADLASSSYGQAVHFTATVSPAPSGGSAEFFDGAASLGTVLVSGGSAALTASALAVGTHSITATFSGAGGVYLGSTSPAYTETVGRAVTAITLGSPANPSTYGQSITLSATVSPASATGTVQFKDGATVLGSVTLAGGAASLGIAALSGGSHSITAVYSGDASYATSTSAVVNQVVNKAASATAVSSSLNPATSGQTVTFTATVTPAAAAGTVQFKDGAAVLGSVTLNAGAATFDTSSLTAGTHSITATYSGDGNYVTSASSALSETVNAPIPGAPSNLTAAAVSSSQINLSWSASPTSGVTYNVYSSNTSGFTPSAGNRIAAGVTGTTYSNTGLTPSTTRYYRVTAQNSAGESAASNQAAGTTQASGVACHVTYSVTNQWNVGFGTAITIKNTGSTPINGWSLTWTWAGNQQITQAWNSNYTQAGASATLTNANWNPTIAPGATLSGMGFNASYSGTNTAPTAFRVNGTLCN